MESEKDRKDRHHLLAVNRKSIEEAYLQAKEQMATPVIVVADTRDKVGEAIVTARVGEAACRAFTENVEGAVPTVILAVELEDARKNFALISPNASQTLSRSLPPDTFWVVAVANGGNTYAALPSPK